MLLHPFGLCADVWEPIVPRLEQHHDVFALTIPGHAGSEPLPPDYGHSIAACVNTLEAKLDALGIRRAHMVGCSLGGWLAIEFARRARALSVVAIAPGGGWELGSREHRRVQRRFQRTRTLVRVGGSVALRVMHWEVARCCLLRDAAVRPARLHPHQAKGLIESIWRCEVYDEMLRALPHHEPVAPFERLPCPVRMVWGACDRVLPMRGYSERWQRVLPGAEWVVLRNAGHLPMFDDPDGIARVILELTNRPCEQEKLVAQGPAAQCG